MIARLILALWLCLPLAAMAQGGMMPGPGTVHTTSVSSFVGVVDKDTTAVDYYGLVAASASAASAGKNAVDLSNNSTTCTAVKVLSTGYLDVSSGLYCNGGTQTVTAWCSTNCAVSSSDTVARITTLYDQVGSANLTASYATAPGFVLAATSSQWSGSKPVGMCVNARSSVMTATITNLDSPTSLTMTFERWGIFTTFAMMLGDPTGGSNLYMGNWGAANALSYVGTGVPATEVTGVTDGTGTTDFSHFHRAMITVPASTGNAVPYVDGTASTTATLTGTSNLLTSFGICGYTGNFADIFFTNATIDNTLVGATAAQNTTNLTTVPLP